MAKKIGQKSNVVGSTRVSLIGRPNSYGGKHFTDFTNAIELPNGQRIICTIKKHQGEDIIFSPPGKTDKAGNQLHLISMQVTVLGGGKGGAL